MAIDPRTRQIIWGKAGATCSFPSCRRSLVREATPEDREVLVGEIAHIVAQNLGGPRAKADVPGGALDKDENLILLCHEHHEIIDQQPNTYPVERLLQFKKDHEEWVRQTLSKGSENEGLSSPQKKVTERVYSTLLPVTQLPQYIFSGDCRVAESEMMLLIDWPKDKRILTPFILRSGKLYTFNNLKESKSPFSAVVTPQSITRHDVVSWSKNPDQMRWYVDLLNRSINKMAGGLGLKYDKEHRRHFFEPLGPGKDRKVAYKSVGGGRSERKVAWNPHLKHNNEPRKYWEHLAVSLRFQLLHELCWGVAIRPERRFTVDGYTPLQGKAVGKKNTKRKSRMYNFDVLKEVQFWRDFLSQGKPRITCLFGQQALVIENTLLSASITWPEVNGDEAHRFSASYEDDLFSFAEREEAEQMLELDEEPALVDADEGDDLED